MWRGGGGGLNGKIERSMVISFCNFHETVDPLDVGICHVHSHQLLATSAKVPHP